MKLLRGERLRLSSLINDSLPFTIKVIVNAPKLQIDFSCFGLNADNKLADDRYMSFYNQPVTPCGAIKLKNSADKMAVFEIDLLKLPTHIDRFIITAAIDGIGTMSQVINGEVNLFNGISNIASFAFSGNDFAAERALMLMEIYRKERSWRIWATGHGFNGGLEALVKHFGGTIDEPQTTTQQSVNQSPDLPPLNFLQRVSKSLFPDKNSSDEPNVSNLTGHWKLQGTSVKVANVIIEGGFIYFGSGLCSIGSNSQAEPALINPNLAVGKLESANYQQRLLTYWPSWSEASPDARAAYIKWLANGRNDPLADIGYVFLYFYGLERRALADTKTDTTAKTELPEIVKEIERLLEIYHSNNSFLVYATGLLELLKLDCPETFLPKQYLRSPPDFNSGAWTLPLSLKLALGQLAIDNQPVPADWAFAWFMAEPTTRLRTSAKRCPVEFKQLFFSRYSESFGKGINVPVNKTKIKISYVIASASFYPNRTIEKTLDIPDVTVLTSRIKKLQALAEQCTETLNTYSRFLGRNPDLAGTLDALLELPYSLWTDQQKRHLQTIKHTVETTKVPVAIEFTKLKAWLPQWQTITKSRVTSFINRLAEAGLGMEPDSRFGGVIPNDTMKVVLFIEDGSFIAPNPRYTTAALTLHLAVVVSMADGAIGKAERALLVQQIEDWLHLESTEKNRLHAHLRWLLSQHPDLKSIKKRVETLPESAREVLGNFLILVAFADNKISANEVKILEKIYKTLQLDVQALYGKLHATNTDNPVTVRLPLPNTGGFTIPPPPEAKTGIQLDMNRIAELKKESKKVSDMLGVIFSGQEEILQAEPVEELLSVDNENLLGLDNAHSTLIKLLCTRFQWTRVELEEIAADCDMMLDGALEHINEAAYDTYDAPLTEGDYDAIEINQDILKELLCDNYPS